MKNLLMVIFSLRLFPGFGFVRLPGLLGLGIDLFTRTGTQNALYDNRVIRGNPLFNDAHAFNDRP